MKAHRALLGSARSAGRPINLPITHPTAPIIIHIWYPITGETPLSLPPLRLCVFARDPLSVNCSQSF